MKITAEFDKKELKAFEKDIDKLLIGMGQELASSPKMRPIVSKIKQGMSENAMGFSNSEIWEKNKHAAKVHGIVDFDSPLMTTGQMVQDFIFYTGKPKLSDIPKSNEFIIGALTWSDKIRKRPSYRHVLNQLARAEGGTDIYEDAEKFTFIKSSDLVKIVMKSPRYPIMDSIVNLYRKDIQLHMERLIDEAFSKKK